MAQQTQGRAFQVQGSRPKERQGAFPHILASLGYRNFRLYFLGMCISLTGTWMQQTAMSWLVYELTGSVLLLAAVNFMIQFPILVFTPFTSIYADRFDRRKILVLTQGLSMLQAAALAALTLGGVIEVWHILFLSLFIGCVNTLDNPTRQSFYPNLVEKEHLGNAIALNSAVINGSRLIGPAVGGVLISLLGEGSCFLLNALSFTAVIAGLLMMHLPPFRPQPRGRKDAAGDMKEGFLYVAGNMPIRSLLLEMAVISFFGLPLMTFIPAYVKDILGGGSEMLGIMLSAIGVGSFLAALRLAARKKVPGLGRTVSVSGIGAGTGLALLSLVDIPWVAVILGIPVGFTVILTVASINTLLQSLSDEDKRGRVMGYMAMTFTGLAPVGSMVLGTAVECMGLPAVIMGSGLCCVAGTLVFAHFRPVLWKYSRPIYIRKGMMPGTAAGQDSHPE